ncbi:MAG: hypothetical protein WD872_10145 [Pirellulaceae bacterium]
MLFAAQALGQLPGGTARPTEAAPAKAELPLPYVTRQSDVEIPFSVKPGNTPDSQPAAVRVFVSWDRGESWHFYEERKPEEGRFRFKPKQDGEFWFATQTVDRSGRTDSGEPRQPQLRLLIDTQKPQLLAQPRVPRRGEVQFAWSAADTSLNPASLKIEYQDAAGSGGVWQQVQVDPAAVQSGGGQMTGRVTFEPAGSSQSINLRAEVADAAGNIAYFSQRLTLAPPALTRQNSAAPPPDRTATRWPSSNPYASPVDEGRALLADAGLLDEGAQGWRAEKPATPPFVDNPYAKREALVAASPVADSRGPIEAESLPPPNALRAEDLPSPTEAAPAEVAPQPETLPESLAPVNELPPTEEAVGTPAGSRPRLTNSRRFSLEYDVETVGPEGLADVELWGTSDGGQTWVKWGSDPDRQSPFDVEVNGEASYGFRVVIVGKSGLTSNAPRNGDTADIWVGIDLTRPTARLVSAAYGQEELAGKLDIRWEAADPNLTDRPVTLAIGDRPDGPFNSIAAGLPNSGQYFWEFDPRSPRQIYLRLEVRDQAGNVAIDQLTEPIRVEGLQPKGRIRGFAPAGEPGAGAFRPPLFR